MKSTIILAHLIILFCSDLFSQDYRKPTTFQEFTDSIENIIKISSSNYKDDIKHLKRWQLLMESRVGPNNSIDAYHKAIRGYLKTKKVAFKSTSAGPEWSFFGPTGIPPHPGTTGTRYSTGKGWVNSLFFDEMDTDTILAGSNHAGLWRSCDHGNSWSPMTDGYSDIKGINSILRSGDNILVSSYISGDFYAYADGVFLSTDDGSTWAAINNGDLSTIYPDFGYINQPRKLYRNPYSTNEIFYLTYSSVYKSTNNGTSWSRIFNHSDTWDVNSFGLMDIEIVQDNSNNETIYISGSKIYKSTNSGSTWLDYTSTITTLCGLTSVSRVSRIEMASNPIYEDNIWFYLSYNNYCYLSKIDDSGSHFYASRSSTSDNKNKLECEVSPNDENVVYTAGLEIQKYDASNNSWIYCSDWNLNISDSELLGGTKWVHADIRDQKIFDNEGIDRIYAGHDGGISWGEWDSSIGDYNFHQISDDGSNGLYITEFYGFDVADNT
ncbi:MAG: hypothetical protein V2B15_02925, partial [Bacteroidota bacterium]